jgi:hypothetical protein
MNRTRVGIAVAVLVAGVVALGSARLLGGHARTLSGEEAIAAAADVLRVPRANMVAKGAPHRGGRGEFFQDFAVDGQPIQVAVPLVPGTFRVDWGPRTEDGAPGHHVSLAEAQRTAEEVVGHRFPDMTAMRLLHADELPIGYYKFAWAQVSASGAMVGNGVSVAVDPRTGRLVTYTENRRPSAASPAEPRVNREQADRMARAILAARVGEGRTLRLAKDFLVLSSPFSEDEGPVWQLFYEDETPPPTARAQPQSVVIDAVTGKDVTNAPFKEGAPPGGTKQ